MNGFVPHGTKMTRIDMLFDWSDLSYRQRNPGEHVKLRKSQKRTVRDITRAMRDRRLRGGPATIYRFFHKGRSLIFAGPSQ